MKVWLRKNLFRSPVDSVATILGGAAIAYVLFRLARFVFVTGRWDVISDNLALFITGSWPQAELWRLVTVVIALTFVAGMVAGFVGRSRMNAPDAPPPRSGRDRIVELVARVWPVALIVGLLLTLTGTGMPWLFVAALLGAAAAGRGAGWYLPSRVGTLLGVATMAGLLASVWFLNAGVGWDSWGGMVLNLFLAAVSITLCFPIGVLLALGRRSDFPIIRWLSTGYIELFRGLPLIALLLMANVALGFFIPQSMAPGKVVRAIVVFVLFTSAYVAEIVRGGLQSVPKGQLEAGRANGLSPVAVTRRIILPQAIRNVIPALVGQFISLFKDTTLAGAALGMTDLLKAAEASTAQQAFRGQGLIAETLVFVLVLFWAGSYTMSRESQRLEARLGIGQR